MSGLSKRISIGSLIILLELIDVSLLILTLNDAKFHCICSERGVIS